MLLPKRKRKKARFDCETENDNSRQRIGGAEIDINGYNCGHS